MKLHHLKPADGSKHRKQRVGRGDRGRRGKTAGRGTTGTGARGTVPAGFEGGQMPLIRRQPKAPGFNNPNKVYFSVVNLSTLERSFEAGDEVTVDALKAKGLVGKKAPVKILGDGELTKALTVDVDRLSASARQRIEEAGGTVR